LPCHDPVGLGASASQLIWMVDAYMVVFASSLLVMGYLGDRFGRALAMRAGLVLFGGASLEPPTRAARPSSSAGGQ